MNERVNPFADIGAELPSFAPKPRVSHGPAKETVERVGEESGFQSRAPSKPQKPARREPRIHRTGRNIQFNAKVSQETHERIYRLADQKDITIAELVEMAFAALEKTSS